MNNLVVSLVNKPLNHRAKVVKFAVEAEPQSVGALYSAKKILKNLHPEGQGVSFPTSMPLHCPSCFQETSRNKAQQIRDRDKNNPGCYLKLKHILTHFETTIFL